jgi:uroporphyrinogen-III synthase
MSYIILSTKKLDPSLQQQLKQEGHLLMEEEFINVTHHISAASAEKIKNITADDVLVFTSANAVEAVKDHIDVNATFSVFCISGKTREAVESLLPNVIIVDTAFYGDELAEKIIASSVEQVVFFCGNIRRDTIPAILSQNNITVKEFVVYQTTETPKQLNADYDAVLFFSPSGVKSFFTANQLKPHVVCFSIGTTTATTIKEYSSNKIIIADAPTQEAVAIHIKNHFKTQVQL